jgi:hypothetical protein
MSSIGSTRSPLATAAARCRLTTVTPRSTLVLMLDVCGVARTETGSSSGTATTEEWRARRARKASGPLAVARLGGPSPWRPGTSPSRIFALAAEALDRLRDRTAETMERLKGICGASAAIAPTVIANSRAFCKVAGHRAAPGAVRRLPAPPALGNGPHASCVTDDYRSAPRHPAREAPCRACSLWCLSGARLLSARLARGSSLCACSA